MSRREFEFRPTVCIIISCTPDRPTDLLSLISEFGLRGFRCSLVIQSGPGLSDGRVVVGKFACFDKQQNILLNEAREWRWDAAKVRSERMVGTVIVPRQHLMSCHVLVEHKEAPEAAG